MVMDFPSAAAEEFRASWDTHHERVRKYLARRVAIDDVDELVAQVFETAWRRWRDVPKGDAQTWWLLATAYRTAGNHYRGRNRRSRLIDRVGISAADRPADEAAASADRMLVHGALAELSAKDREVLVLSAWDDLDVPSIAAVLGLSVEATQKRLTRARERFRSVYEKFHRELSDDGDYRTLNRQVTT